MRTRSTSPVPNFRMSPSGSRLSAATASARSPRMTVAFHVVSLSVREATCLGIELMRSASSPLRSGHASLKPS